jgi:hypothetical protein
MADEKRWPREHWLCQECGHTIPDPSEGHAKDCRDQSAWEPIAVISADVGRELYEALAEMELPPFSRQLNALARYENAVETAHP